MTFLSGLSLLKLYYGIPSAAPGYEISNERVRLTPSVCSCLNQGCLIFCCNDILDFGLKDSHCISHFQNWEIRRDLSVREDECFNIPSQKRNVLPIEPRKRAGEISNRGYLIALQYWYLLSTYLWCSWNSELT